MNLSVLEEYIETGNHQDLEFLLLKEPDLIKENTSHGISPLLLACHYHKPSIVRILLKFIKTITIHEACAVGLLRHVQMMVESKKEVLYELSSHGLTALGIAVYFNHEEIVRYLLSQGADPNICSQNDYQVFPLHTASSENNDTISKLLLDAGAEVNVQQQGGYTPLHFAAAHGNIDLIIALLELGADVNAKTSQNETAADFAIKKGHHEIASILKATS